MTIKMSSRQLNSLLASGDSSSSFSHQYIRFLSSTIAVGNEDRPIPTRFYQSFVEGYDGISKNALRELKALNNESLIDVKSEEFRDDDDLKLKVKDLIGALSLGKSEELLDLLKEMGFDKKFRNQFITAEALSSEIKALMDRLDYNNEMIARVIFLLAGSIVYYQVNFRMEASFGEVKKAYNNSKYVMRTKIFLDKLLRRKRILDSPEFDANPTWKKQLGEAQAVSFIKTLKKLTGRNHNGGFNLAQISDNIYRMCSEITTDELRKKPKDHVYLAVYPLFELIYPNDIKITANPKQPVFRAEDEGPESLSYLRDSKIYSVKVITGRT